MQYLYQKKNSKQQMKNIKQLDSAFLFASVALSMSANAADVISIYKDKPLKDSQIFLESSGQQLKFNGTNLVTPKGDVQLQTSSKKNASDVLRFSWKDTWYSSMTLEAAAPLNLA